MLQLSSRTSMRHGFKALAATLLLWQVPLAAHDMWIEPATFRPEVGQIVSVRLRVGQDLLGDPLALDPSLVNQFLLQDAEGRKPIIRRDGGDPAGLLRVATPGSLVIGYQSHPSAIEIGADKFNQYLKEEGLDAVAAIRASRKESGAAAHELFSRCAKSLIFTGSPSDAQGDRPLGFQLELIAERNPYDGRADQGIPFRLLYENRPLAGALVVAMNRLNPAEKISARTDAEGRVRFALPAAGMWLVKAVHMVPAAAGSHAEWASFWASLTFERRKTSAGT